MSQITSGIRSVLTSPLIYDALQNIMGAKTVRKELVNEFIKSFAGCRILDIGCGTAEILEYLPENVEYFGFDISPEYIESAKSRYGSRAKFHCGILDASMLKDYPKFDRVLALGVLHHLSDDEARSLFHLAKDALAPGGYVVTFDPCYASGQNPIARYLISRDRGQNVRNSTGYNAIASEHFSSVKGVLKHRAWIPYTHWFMECEK